MTSPQAAKTSQRLAITGGRGRLAPGVAAHLRGAGYEVVLFSRNAGEGFRSMASLAVPEVLGEFDAVLHLGWSTVPLVSEENPGLEQEQDFPFVDALVAAAEGTGNRPKLVFFSTAAVYGNTFEAPATEETPCRPLGRYAAAKLAAEGLLARRENSCVLRVTNVFGAGCPLTRPQGIVPVLLQAARAGGEIPVWGDGTAVKDYLAAPDLHRAVEAVLASDLRGVFNVSSGLSLSVNELVSVVEEACGHAIRRRHLPHYLWDVTLAQVSAEKLQRATGWKAALLPHDALRQFAG